MQIPKSLKEKRFTFTLPELDVKTTVFGPTPPNVFVGWNNYPRVSWGPMVSISHEDASFIDDPTKWFGLSTKNIVEYRSMLLRSRIQQNIYEKTKLLDKAQEAILSVKPIDVEIDFLRKPDYRITFSNFMQPMGPSAPIKDFRICGNPVIPKKVDEVFEERLKAEVMLSELFSSKFDVYYLTKLLSAGTLGIKTKLVPTRWSITAVDDTISKKLIKKIKTYPEVSDYQVYTSEYLSNHFEILLIPGKWEFEQFEVWSPKTVWTKSVDERILIEDYEGWDGRTTYSEVEGGGYYAGRFATTEALENMRKQARVVVFREIYEGYTIPVGVWQVREQVRHAFKSQAKRFSTLKEALGYLGTRLRVPIIEYVKKSRIVRQSRLGEF
jgi:hypothetical protein